MSDGLSSAFNNLPSYVREAPKFAKFLELLNDYIYSAAVEMANLKNGFLVSAKSNFIIDLLSKQSGISMKVPFSEGSPNWQQYYAQLYLAYRARSFVSGFRGTQVGFIEGAPLRDVSSMSVIDFSVAKGDYSPMSVLYSVLSIDPYFTAGIAREYLIPSLTGVNASLYFLQFGQDVFGFDRDGLLGKRIVYKSNPGQGESAVEEVDIEDAKYLIGSATISEIGTGYDVGDEVSVNGVVFRIEALAVGAFVRVLDDGVEYTTNPSGVFSVTGGSGTGMVIVIRGTSKSGHFIRGFDNGEFFTITRKS